MYSNNGLLLNNTHITWFNIDMFKKIQNVLFLVARI